MLLQTAQVLICHPEVERKAVQTRLIFDSGSQQNYILEDVRQKLSLPRVAKVNVVVNVFSNLHGKAQSLSSVILIVKKSYGNSSNMVTIETLLFPCICPQVQGQDIDLTH